MNDILARAKAALTGVAEGPWRVERWEDFSGHEVSYSLPDISQWSGYRNTVDCGGDKALAGFIAEARSLVPELVAEVERLRAALKTECDAADNAERQVCDYERGGY